jgi:CheY-like chemotaxis protein
MEGWEATHLIEAAPETATIPIIALAAHTLSSDRAKSVEVGCADFDTEPVDMPRLLGKISACLDASRPCSSEKQQGQIEENGLNASSIVA